MHNKLSVREAKNTTQSPGCVKFTAQTPSPVVLPSLASTRPVSCRATSYEMFMGGCGSVDFSLFFSLSLSVFYFLWQRIFICLHRNSTEAPCGSNSASQIKVSRIRKGATWAVSTQLKPCLSVCVLVGLYKRSQTVKRWMMDG